MKGESYNTGKKNEKQSWARLQKLGFIRPTSQQRKNVVEAYLSKGKEIKLKGYDLIKLPNEELLNDVSMEPIPVRFIEKIAIHLNNSTTLNIDKEGLTQINTTEDIFEDDEIRKYRDMVVDIDIVVDTTKLKNLVYKYVGELLATQFKDDNPK